MKITKVNYNCPKCNLETVEVQAIENKNKVDIKIKKCSNCKYQSGLKEVLNFKYQ